MGRSPGKTMTDPKEHKLKESLSVIAFAVALIAISVFVHSRSSDVTPAGHVPISQPVQPSEATAKSDASGSAAQGEDDELTGQPLQQVYSDFIGKLTSDLAVMDAARMMYAGRIRQDMQFSDLTALRTDAENFRQAMQDHAAVLSTISEPINISDENAKLFSDAQDAASDIAADAVTIAVDFAVQANTGLSDDEPTKIAAGLPGKRRLLKKAVLTGYKKLGVPSTAIDAESYQLK